MPNYQEIVNGLRGEAQRVQIMIDAADYISQLGSLENNINELTVKRDLLLNDLTNNQAYLAGLKDTIAQATSQATVIVQTAQDSATIIIKNAQTSADELTRESTAKGVYAVADAMNAAKDSLNAITAKVAEEQQKLNDILGDVSVLEDTRDKVLKETKDSADQLRAIKDQMAKMLQG
jgi:chromosome segregation ATPase